MPMTLLDFFTLFKHRPMSLCVGNVLGYSDVGPAEMSVMHGQLGMRRIIYPCVITVSNS